MAPPAKIRFPRLLEQPLAVERVLDGIDGPATAEQVASRFSHVRLARVAKALDTLARYGWIIQLPDGRYLSRKVA